MRPMKINGKLKTWSHNLVLKENKESLNMQWFKKFMKKIGYS